MNTSKYEAWIQRILATETEEISCSDCFDLLPGYVEAEVLHRQTQELFVQVKQHLFQCQVCREEYEILHDLAQMDVETEEPPGEE